LGLVGVQLLSVLRFGQSLGEIDHFKHGQPRFRQRLFPVQPALSLSS
jgi:hypothetical protein